MYLGVSFDFYGTLVELDQDVPSIGQELSARGFTCSAEIESIWNSGGFDGRETHDPKIVSYDEWRLTCIAHLAELCGANTIQAFELARELLALDRHWKIRKTSVAPALLAASDRPSIRRCILSNWDYPIAPYLAMANLPVNINAVISADIGFRKPNAEAFVRARELMNVSASRHIHVGDDWHTDVVGSIQSGTAYVLWLTSSAPQPLPPRIVQAHPNDVVAKLLGLIERIEDQP